MKNIQTAAADRRFGLVLIIISAASFGVMPIFEPIVAVVLAAIVLGETISPIQILGGILILAAVVLLATSDKWRGKLRRIKPENNKQSTEPSQKVTQDTINKQDVNMRIVTAKLHYYGGFYGTYQGNVRRQ